MIPALLGRRIYEALFPATRTPANLSQSMHHQLSAYALAASAAGVGILACPQIAKAKIVYTAAHMRVPENGQIDLDLNHDGNIDFTFAEVHSCTTYAPNARLWATPLRSNEVWGVQNYDWTAAALPAGFRVKSNSAFKQYNSLYMAIITSQGSFAPWIGNKQAYLGLKFYINGKIHYGWARFRVETQKGHCPVIKAILTGYAYETIPNKAIITGKTKGPDEIDTIAPPNPSSVTAPIPKPATLAALALGSPGLSIWRRKESAESEQQRP
jgi:hypothetical protein